MTRVNNHVKPVEHVRVPKTAELVAANLRRQIITGEVQEGDALPPESELTERFGVSRPTLREALRILESEALISIRRGAKGGARVRRPDVAVAARYAGTLLQASGTTVEDVNVARAVIEPAAVRMMAERPTKRAIAQLQAVIDDEEAALDDPAAFADLAVRFHETIVELSGNNTLAVLIGMLREILSAHLAPTQGRRQPGDLARDDRKAWRAHQKLLALIAAGDVDGASDYWARHIAAVDQLVGTVRGRKTVLDLLG